MTSTAITKVKEEWIELPNEEKAAIGLTERFERLLSRLEDSTVVFQKIQSKMNVLREKVIEDDMKIDSNKEKLASNKIAFLSIVQNESSKQPIRSDTILFYSFAFLGTREAAIASTVSRQWSRILSDPQTKGVIWNAHFKQNNRLYHAQLSLLPDQALREGIMATSGELGVRLHACTRKFDRLEDKMITLSAVVKIEALSLAYIGLSLLPPASVGYAEGAFDVGGIV